MHIDVYIICVCFFGQQCDRDAPLYGVPSPVWSSILFGIAALGRPEPLLHHHPCDATPKEVLPGGPQTRMDRSVKRSLQSSMYPDVLDLAWSSMVHSSMVQL